VVVVSLESEEEGLDVSIAGRVPLRSFFVLKHTFRHPTFFACFYFLSKAYRLVGMRHCETPLFHLHFRLDVTFFALLGCGLEFAGCVELEIILILGEILLLGLAGPNFEGGVELSLVEVTIALLREFAHLAILFPCSNKIKNYYNISN